MRGTPVLAALLASAFVGVSAFPLNATDVDYEWMHEMSKRAADDCFGVNLRSRINDNGADIAPSDCTKASNTNGFGGSFFFHKEKVGPAITAKTNLATDTKVTVITNKQKNGKGSFTCDHIVEINVLKSILLEKGGVCEMAAAAATAPGGSVRASRDKIIKIRDVLIRPKNLASLTARVEDEKTWNTQRFGGTSTASAGKNELDFLAMWDYLQKTMSASLETAAALDNIIRTEFPGAPIGVLKKWTQYIAYTRIRAATKKATAERKIENLKREASCTPPPKMARSLADFGAMIAESGVSARGLEDAFSSLALTSLERRASGAARSAKRSGPQAAAAPACPLPGQQKKVVPRNQMKTKPKPTTKPRKPAHKPAPRKPAAPKKKVPRPANRPQRAVGKPAPPKKRVTPKKVPKRVPKPASRPKGKPRGRRH